MTNTDTQTLKPLYASYYEKIVRLNLRNNTMSTSGKVIDIGEIFLTLEHRDGRKTLIRLSEIAAIVEVPRREAV